MEQLIKGMYWIIFGYLNGARKRADYLKGLIAAARNGEYEEDALKAYEEEYEHLNKEIQKLSDLAEEIANTHI